ncbi:hypothetical protein [Sorangium sp. So ce204]|uniref:hypothetical protein n=1 Tax=Sorangium sp. So ce204 TaxID=3133288 RepID=UPI003F5FF881
MVEVDVLGTRHACGPVEGARGTFAALVEVAICSALVALVVAVLATLAVLAMWRSVGTADPNDLLAVEVATAGEVASMPRFPGLAVKLAVHVRAGVRRS